MGAPSKAGDHKTPICQWIAEGKSLAAYCREKKIDYSTVMDWLNADSAFANNYTRAREESAEADADKVADVANRVVAGEIDPNAARVAIDAYKWAAGKRKPKKYGDKLEIDATIQGEIKVTIGGDA